MPIQDGIYARTSAQLEPRCLERHGCPIQYFSGGPANAPAVLCLHGALMDHRMFNAQVPALSDHHRVLTWDARGHGASQPIGLDRPTLQDYVDDAVALLDAAGIERVVVMGQSMGGYVAQHLARQHPERVHALVIIGSTPISFPLKRWEYWALTASTPIFSCFPWKSLKPYIARNTAIDPEVVAYAESAADAVDRKTFSKIWRAVGTAVRPEGYTDFRLKVPCLLTHGDQDGAGTIRRDGPIWASREPQIEYEVIANAGHNANQDNAEAFNAVLTDFLARHRPW